MTENADRAVDKIGLNSEIRNKIEAILQTKFMKSEFPEPVVSEEKFKFSRQKRPNIWFYVSLELSIRQFVLLSIQNFSWECMNTKINFGTKSRG